MSKQIYISADYSNDYGDRDVVDTLNKWGSDNLHSTNFIDMSKVASGSVSRDAGSSCSKAKPNQVLYPCTPYKQNSNGNKWCKRIYIPYGYQEDVYEINTYSYLRHEFEQAKKRNKLIIIVYNSTRYESKWLPSYMSEYEDNAFPFWKINTFGDRVGNYNALKEVLGNV